MNTPRQLRGELFNIVAAGIVALLIWAYANDRTRESATVAGTVRITATDPRTQYVEPTTAINVSLEVRGSRRSIESVEDALRTGISLATSGSGGVPSEPGVHTVDLANALMQEASIHSTGVEIVRMSPESVRVTIGRLVTDQVPVKPVLPRASVQGDIVVDPAVVAVTLPEAAREAVGALALDVVVDTKNLEPGRTHAVDVELKVPEALSRWKELIRIVPQRTKVVFSLLATTAEFTLASVPIELAASPAALANYDFTLPGGGALTSVVVTGPLASIDSLRNGDFAPAAIVALGPADLAAGMRRVRVASWRLPEGVTVVSTAGVAVSAAAPFPEVSVDVQLRAPASSGAE